MGLFIAHKGHSFKNLFIFTTAGVNAFSSCETSPVLHYSVFYISVLCNQCALSGNFENRVTDEHI